MCVGGTTASGDCLPTIKYRRRTTCLLMVFECVIYVFVALTAHYHQLIHGQSLTATQSEQLFIQIFILFRLAAKNHLQNQMKVRHRRTAAKKNANHHRPRPDTHHLCTHSSHDP